MRIAIVTDSTAWLPPQDVREHGIFVVPLSVNFGTRSYREGVDLDTEVFSQLLATEATFPTTSQPALGDIVQTFEAALREHDQVIALFLSGQLSGTVRTAQMAADMVGGDITVIDTNSASYGIGFPVLEAARMASAGVDKDTIITRIRHVLRDMQLYFVVDSLDHLRRGGRISSFQATFGSLLQIKPILTVTSGAIVPYEKVRTKRRAIEGLLDRIREMRERTESLMHLAIIQLGAPQEAEELDVQARETIANLDIRHGEVCPVLGTHVGPGVFGVIFYPD